MSRSVAAILLAAGRSRRMGSCKQLLPLGGTTVIGRCLETLVAGGIEEIVVVVSGAGEEVAGAAGRYPVRVAVNGAADSDMASSVRIGLAAVSPDAGGIVVALCDYPLLLPSTVTRLLQEHLRSPDSIIIPSHNGRRGHPLLFPRGVLSCLDEGETLRDLVGREAGRVQCHAVDDPGVLQDMDTPEDYRLVCARSKTWDA